MFRKTQHLLLYLTTYFCKDLINRTLITTNQLRHIDFQNFDHSLKKETAYYYSYLVGDTVEIDAAVLRLFRNDLSLSIINK